MWNDEKGNTAKLSLFSSTNMGICPHAEWRYHARPTRYCQKRPAGITDLSMLKCRVLKTELLLHTGLDYHKNIIIVGDTVALVIDSRQALDIDSFLSLIFCYKRQKIFPTWTTTLAMILRLICAVFFYHFRAIRLYNEFLSQSICYFDTASYLCGLDPTREAKRPTKLLQF